MPRKRKKPTGVASGYGGGIMSEHDNNGSMTEKPHGRRCWAIHFGGQQYLDVSVMPRQQNIPAIAKALAPLP